MGDPKFVKITLFNLPFLEEHKTHSVKATLKFHAFKFFFCQ
jgi:hypothetical protein